MVLPFYIPVISLLCSLLLINSKRKYLNKISIFFYSFILLIFTEMTVRYTGLNELLRVVFITLPFVFLPMIYLFLIVKFSKESKIT